MRGSRVLKKTAILGIAGALSTVGLAACGGGDSGSGSDSKTVTIWSSVDQPVQDGLESVLQKKADADGIKIDWQKVDNINQIIMTKLQSGDTPDIAFIPQPGVVADIVSRGKAFPLDFLDQANLDTMTPGTLDAGTVDDKLYGLLVSMNVKSLVFYPKKAWDAGGYQAPDSLSALEQLTDQIKSDGVAPWCVGIESDTATGWPMTDWFEDLIMRYGGADVYNQWVSHDVKFDSDVVRQAAAEIEKLLFTDGNTPGGQKSIASVNFGDADDPMWDNPPGCMMEKQGSFIIGAGAGFFPDDVVADLDANVGVFGFPPAEAGGDNPVLGGGDLAMMLNDSDNVKTVMKYLSETDIGNEAAPKSSFISPHTDFDMKLYPNDITRQIADVAYKSTNFLFDGSDAMPGEVGAGSFWKEITAWTTGSESLDDALKNIDDSWPAS